MGICREFWTGGVHKELKNNFCIWKGKKILHIEPLLCATLFAFSVNPHYKPVRLLQMRKLRFQVEPWLKQWRSWESSTGDSPSSAYCFPCVTVPLAVLPGVTREVWGDSILELTTSSVVLKLKNALRIICRACYKWRVEFSSIPSNSVRLGCAFLTKNWHSLTSYIYIYSCWCRRF